ncbi:MAG TPA: hypothetical protein VGJ28_18485 [Micromonosporaceae bacterium]
MGIFATTAPVRDEERVWIEAQLRWLTEQFGRVMLGADAVLPTDDFFPGTYTGSVDNVREVIDRIAARMDVPPDTYVVELADADDHGDAIASLPGYRTTSGAAGEYRRTDSGGLLSISMTQTSRPMSLVATIAHHRLMGEGHVEPGRRDNEPLTDLATVYFGFGIFSANAALEFAPTSRLNAAGERMTGWRSSRLGYLTEPMFGYALAYWSHLRGDDDPAWARYVDANPKAYLRRGLKYLRTVSSGS